MNTSKQLSKFRIEEIGNQAIDWAFGHGLIFVKRKTDVENTVINKPIVTHIPISLFPSKFPRKLYEQAVSLSKDYNLLVHHLSKDFHYIQNTLKSVSDPFTQSLLEIHRKIEKEGKKQQIELGIFRSDYMVHQTSQDGNGNINNNHKLYQVELNTISSSFGCISSRVFQLHKYLINDNRLHDQYPNHPENHSELNITNAMAKAFKLYGNDDAVVLMIVQEDERNIWDQKSIEYKLSELYGIKMIRKTLSQIDKFASLNGNGNLLIDGYEIAIAYYRAGYTPNDYPSQKEWDARLLIERSTAIKCPSIANHLVGAKKIQQAIAKKGVLESLLKDQESVQKMRSSWTGLYSLSEEDIDMEAVEKAKQNPQLYVMKPQREGGGNNIYGEAVRHSLETMSRHELSSFILMDRIIPTPFKAHILRDRELFEIDALYELGIFGLYIGNGNQIELNQDGGILLRTKTSSSDEGGVAAGFAVIDSLVLE